MKQEKKMRILMVTKDETGGLAALKVAKALLSFGYYVEVAAEGLSVPIWKKAGWKFVFEGTNNFIEEPFRIDQNELLIAIKPDVVVTTLSNPINLEDRLSQAANCLEIPLVWLQDTWGVENRSNAVPQLICVIDNLAERTILANPKFKSGPPKIDIVGNLAMEELPDEMIPRVSRKRIAMIKTERGYTVFLAGQGSYTDDVIRVVRKSIAMSSKPCVVIPRLHNKYQEGQKPYLDLFKKGEIVEIPESEIPLRHLAALCDATVAVFSTLLPVAAYFRKVPISVLTLRTQEGMMESTDFDRYPLSATGTVVEIKEPIDLAQLIEREIGKERITITPFSARNAACAIIKCANKHFS